MRVCLSFHSTNFNKSSKAFGTDLRGQCQLLNKVLDEILTGKFYYHSNHMFEKISLEDLQKGKTSKYLKGLNYK